MVGFWALLSQRVFSETSWKQNSVNVWFPMLCLHVLHVKSYLWILYLCQLKFFTCDIFTCEFLLIYFLLVAAEVFYL